jgi:hypothetical protein
VGWCVGSAVMEPLEPLEAFNLTREASTYSQLSEGEDEEGDDDAFRKLGDDPQKKQPTAEVRFDSISVSRKTPFHERLHHSTLERVC